MNEKLVYLDSSAIVKRYTKETGTSTVDFVYRQAELGKLVVGFSIWNIGETVGALDRYHTRGVLSDEEFRETLKLLYGENEKMMRLDSLRIEPIGYSLLQEAWSLITRHHIYISDALQLSTAKKMNAKIFLTADGLLLEKANEEEIQAYDIEEEEEIFQILDEIM